MIDRIALEAVAEACRSGLESLADKKISMFHEFPNRACGPAAEILGRIVKERLQYDGFMCAVKAIHFSALTKLMPGLRSGISSST